jgi:hypothetical protein
MPFLDSPKVSGPALIVDDEGHGAVAQTFREHNESAHATVAILERKDLIEAHMKVQNLHPLDFGLHYYV